jgi:hypothetical protein
MAASSPNEPDDLLITDELHHRIAHKAADVEVIEVN